MDIFEVEQKETLKREEVAERLRKLADMLARHNEIEFERAEGNSPLTSRMKSSSRSSSTSRPTSASWRSS